MGENPVIAGFDRLDHPRADPVRRHAASEHALHRLARRGGLADLDLDGAQLARRLDDPRRRHAGHQHRNVDAGFGEFVAQRHRDSERRIFRADIGDRDRGRHDRDHRRGDDEVARLAARLHLTEEGAAGIEMRMRVDRIVPAPDVGVILFERPRSAADSGVAEQDADGGEVARLRAGFGPALFAGDVELEAERVGAFAAQRGCGRFGAGAVDIGEDYRGALRGERLGGRKPEPARAAGDEGGLSRDVGHSAKSFSR